MADMSVWAVVFAAFLTAVTTGLGALPFLSVHEIRDWWLGIFNAVAGGRMLAANHSLIVEGSAMGGVRVLLGVLVELGLIVLANTMIERQGEHDVAELAGGDARKALLILGVMTAHSFAEGVGVGVSFGGGEELGVFITAAIAVHNIPEGLAISLVLVPRGTPVWTAVGWSVLTSLPQPIMAPCQPSCSCSCSSPFCPSGSGWPPGP